MNEQVYAGTAQYNLIYIFAIPDEAHKGYLKIGEHSFSSPSSYKQLTDSLDMAFCLDVSNSMKFPSSLLETTASYYDGGKTDIPIYRINNSGWWGDNRNWLDTSRDYDNPYYLVADASNTSTVFKIYFKEGNWRAIDASRSGEYENNGTTKRYFIIGQEDFSTNYGQDASPGRGWVFLYPCRLWDSDSG